MAIATSLSIQASETKVLKGILENDISGWLKRLDTGAGLGGKKIRLWRKKPSEASLRFYYEIGNYLNGYYVFRVGDWNEVGIYKFQTEFLGDAEFAPCKSPILEIECYVPVPTAVPTNTGIGVSPSKVLTPAYVTVSGKLIRKDTGAGIPNKQIYVYRKRPSTVDFVLHGMPSTNGAGNYSMSSLIEEQGETKFYAKFLGDAEFQASESSVVSVIGEAPKATLLPIEFVITPKYKGDIADIHGKLTGNGQALASKPVYCYIKKSGGTWIQDEKLLTLSDGSIIWVTDPLDIGSYEFQMKFQGDAYYKPCESNILTAKVEEKVTPPPPPPPPIIPEGATNALRCYYYNLFGKSHEEIQAGVHNVVVPLIATWTTLAGWTYLGEEVYDKDNYFEIYFKPTGDPVTLPLKAILATICVAIIGIVIFWCAWVYLETKKMEYEERKSIEELYREGLISEETYRSLMEKYAPKDTWTWIMNMLPYLLLFMIIASIAGALPRGRRD